ncbi:MAG: transcriptional regulator [Legionellales bacterium RIFCSPHIGHO2_12_FULL_42_9]|nr:MAG: transcriptional regulator [Legionellales bacterium RIFCSPHIGHO2_12_FULL_42_9]
MNKYNKRPYSRYCQEAATLLGMLIQEARKEKRMTLRDLAERANISRGTLHKIEHGNLSCELGIVFEVAATVGVSLFAMNEENLSAELRRAQSKLHLLPKRIRNNSMDFDDDF